MPGSGCDSSQTMFPFNFNYMVHFVQPGMILLLQTVPNRAGLIRSLFQQREGELGSVKQRLFSKLDPTAEWKTALLLWGGKRKKHFVRTLLCSAFNNTKKKFFCGRLQPWGHFLVTRGGVILGCSGGCFQSHRFRPNFTKCLILLF